MKTIKLLIAIAVITILFYSFNFRPSEFESTEQATDSLAADRAKHIAAVKEMIKGKEKMPVDSVFKNIEIAKGAPADRLLRMMEGFSIALGVKLRPLS